MPLPNVRNWYGRVYELVSLKNGRFTASPDFEILDNLLYLKKNWYNFFSYKTHHHHYNLLSTWKHNKTFYKDLYNWHFWQPCIQQNGFVSVSVLIQDQIEHICIFSKQGTNSQHGKGNKNRGTFENETNCIHLISWKSKSRQWFNHNLALYLHGHIFQTWATCA